MDSEILKKFADATQKEMGEAAVSEKDFRKILEKKDVDAITIASPDHWHTPMAISGTASGKARLRRKALQPQSCRRRDAGAAQQKYGKLVQMGTQQRSSAHTIEIIEKIHCGTDRQTILAKAWYSNIRKSIGTGKEAPVPTQVGLGSCGKGPRRAAV